MTECYYSFRSGNIKYIIFNLGAIVLISVGLGVQLERAEPSWVLIQTLLLFGNLLILMYQLSLIGKTETQKTMPIEDFEQLTSLAGGKGNE